MAVPRIPFRWQVFIGAATPVAFMATLIAVLSVAQGPARGEAPATGSMVLSNAPPQQSAVRRAEADSGPALIDALRAADVLAKAGKLPGYQPPLIEVLQAADALERAGKLPRYPPPLIEVLQAADALARAGALPGYQASGLPFVSEEPPASAVEPPAAASPSGWYDGRYDARVLTLVNGERAAAGLLPLAAEPRLTDAAAAYAKVLADGNWFSHTGPDGSTLVSRMQLAGFPFNAQVGEVLAWGTNGWSPEDAVTTWIGSPMHREELLSAAYGLAGVGCYFTGADNITVRCVIDFAG